MRRETASPPASGAKRRTDHTTFLAEVERLLRSVCTATYYQLLDVQPNASRAELKRRFYQLARRFHPDYHMDHPEWTSRLQTLMDGLTTAYRTLSNDKTRKDYDRLIAAQFAETQPDAHANASDFVEKARECMAAKNYAASILWMHRAIGSEPNSSDYRVMLGQCLSAIPEYRREAIEQFEKAIQLEPRNLNAHFYYANLLERMKLPGRAKGHYQRVLELDMNHRDAREALIRLNVSSPRTASRGSLLNRLTGRKAR
jgi:curved DNA-binding protein CbpA